jgi:[ribosomal protein S5]-alanine N-acetyltransferase
MEAKNVFEPYPTIRTSRLLLREMTLDDAEAFFRERSDPEVIKYWGSDPDASIDETRRRIEVVREGVRAGTAIRWTIADPESGAFLGSGGFWRWDQRHFRAEIGYDLSRAHWGRGLMTEAIGAMLRFGFEVMNLHSVEANVDPHNEASKRVLEKLGFRQEGFFRENFFYAGKFTDTAVFSLLRAP